MTLKVMHGFVGSCVESEAIREIYNDIEICGFGIEPTFYSLTNVDNYIQCDLKKGLPVNTKFDFGLFQPPCTRFSLAKNTHYSEYENLIPVAKEIAESYCDYWVIENIRNSPIGYKPDLRLKGDMFNLPIKYERVFWSNFDIKQPNIVTDIDYVYNIAEINKAQAKEIKGYKNRYYAHDIIMNSLPKPYVEYIMEYVPL